MAEERAPVAAALAALDRDPAEAERFCRAALAENPDLTEVRVLLSEALRRRGSLSEALDEARVAAARRPFAFDTQRQLGQVLEQAGDLSGAIAAFAQAARNQPTHPTIWRELARLHTKIGDEAAAQAALARHAAFAETARAMQYRDTARAQQTLREHLHTYPADAEAHRLLAEICLAQGAADLAERALREAIEAEPTHVLARRALAQLLNRQSRYQEALTEARSLLTLAPADDGAARLLATALVNLGAYEDALAVYQELLERTRAQPDILLSYGHVQRTLGAYDESVRAFVEAIDRAPGYGEAYWALANLKSYVFDAATRQRLSDALARSDTSRQDRVALNYAAGKALEDERNYAASWSHYQEGARLQRSIAGYNAAATTEAVSKAIARFSADFLAQRSNLGAPAHDPIFILGLPRSGSTLVEQILASHSAVEGTLEMPDLPLAARELALAKGARAGATYLDVLAEAEPGLLRELGERYLNAAGARRRLGRAFFVDKQPTNWIFVGFIALILPNAKIIDARREPLSCCLSCFKQLFAGGQGFSYGLADLGNYYRDYLRMMRHWDQVLPGRVHRVIHDDLVVAPEPTIRSLLAYCGLPFETACLSPHLTSRAVHTASSEQVRRPISADVLNAYAPFDPWLGELRGALGDALDNWR